MIGPIKPKDLVLPPVDVWFRRWFVLTAGDMDRFNSMTVAWGSIGGIWEMPMVQVVVRPSRYTIPSPSARSPPSTAGTWAFWEASRGATATRSH
jgi:hypothetical protein